MPALVTAGRIKPYPTALLLDAVDVNFHVEYVVLPANSKFYYPAALAPNLNEPSRDLTSKVIKQWPVARTEQQATAHVGDVTP